MPDDRKLNKEALYSLIDMRNPLTFQGLEGINTDELLPDAQIPIDMMIFREGEFEHPWFGDLEFTEADLDQLIDNFNRGVVPRQIHFNIDHSRYTGTAIGWLEAGALTKARVEIPGPLGSRMMWVLMAKVMLNRLGAQLINQREYLYFSSEIHPDFSTREKIQIDVDNQAVIRHGSTLVGGAITNNPFIPGMAQISFSDMGQDDFAEQGFVVSATEAGLTYFALAKDQEGGSVAQTQPETKTEEETQEEQFGQEAEEVNETETEPGSTDFSEGEDTPVEDEIVTQDNLENKMNFSEVMKRLSEIADLGEQISYLDGVSQNFSGSDLTAIEVVLLSKRQAYEAQEAQAEAVRKAANASKEVSRLKETNKELTLGIAEAKQGAWDSRVSEFAAQLHAENHYPAVVSKVTEILEAASVKSREYQFALDGEEETDLMGVIKSVLSTLPDAAKVDLSENFNADGQSEVNKPSEVEVAPVANFTEPAAPAAEEDNSEDSDAPAGYHDGVKMYEAAMGHKVDASLYDSIDAEGNLSF